MPYQPPQELLDRYAEVLVGWGLGHGDGISEGDIVGIFCPEDARPLFHALHGAVWRAGGNVVAFYSAAADVRFNETRLLIETGTDAQVAFFADTYRRGIIDQIDHLLSIDCVRDPHAHDGLDPARMMSRAAAGAPYSRWMYEKEHAGRLSWAVGLYGTEGMAREAGLTLEQYWEQIIAGCRLTDPEPLARWRATDHELRDTARWLTELAIDRIHVAGPDADLTLTLGDARRWIGGEGANVPTYEVFTSPDWRGTEGWIRFDEPLQAYGALIRGIRLEFTGGEVVSATATENESLLRELLAVPNAGRVGEFSLTDARLSPITHFMAATLFDENRGGRYGNTHIALGDAYLDAFAGDPAGVDEAERERLGLNECAIHQDIVSTTARTVTATLADGSDRVIYIDGSFTRD